jgi:PTH1 family peptidyl-tRNA hydrolase
MPVIIGLGNPGSKYAGTRHNIGFEFIDRLAQAQSVSLGPGKGPFHIGTGHYQGEKLVLVKPTTFMNLSGDAVQQVLHWYKIGADQCLVCYDDLDLPLGTIRLRNKGSAGGHNGVKDIIRKLGTNVFPRLRLGIGNGFPKGRQVQFVLSKFNQDELPVVDSMLNKALDASLCFAREGVETAMNLYN